MTFSLQILKLPLAIDQVVGSTLAFFLLFTVLLYITVLFGPESSSTNIVCTGSLSAPLILMDDSRIGTISIQVHLLLSLGLQTGLTLVRHIDFVIKVSIIFSTFSTIHTHIMVSLP